MMDGDDIGGGQQPEILASLMETAHDEYWALFETLSQAVVDAQAQGQIVLDQPTLLSPTETAYSMTPISSTASGSLESQGGQTRIQQPHIPSISLPVNSKGLFDPWSSNGLNPRQSGVDPVVVPSPSEPLSNWMLSPQQQQQHPMHPIQYQNQHQQIQGMIPPQPMNLRPSSQLHAPPQAGPSTLAYRPDLIPPPGLHHHLPSVPTRPMGGASLYPSMPTPSPLTKPVPPQAQPVHHHQNDSKPNESLALSPPSTPGKSALSSREARRERHKQSEKERRVRASHGYDTLLEILPPSLDDAGSKKAPSRNEILNRCVDHIQNLSALNVQYEAEILRLRQRVGVLENTMHKSIQPGQEQIQLQQQHISTENGFSHP